MRKMTHRVQEILNKVIMKSLIRKLGDQKTVDGIKCWKKKQSKKSCQFRILYLVKHSLKIRKIKTLLDKQKLKSLLSLDLPYKEKLNGILAVDMRRY